ATAHKHQSIINQHSPAALGPPSIETSAPLRIVLLRMIRTDATHEPTFHRGVACASASSLPARTSPRTRAHHPRPSIPSAPHPSPSSAPLPAHPRVQPLVLPLPARLLQARLRRLRSPL
ncbi:hypothetical protein OC835_007547, partial [Tilletia horrida]